MKLIVGLGNPGPEYQNSRHNVGFGLIDLIARQWDIPLSRRKFDAKFGSGTRRDEQIILLQPQTYMNRSGQCVATAAGFYKIERCDLLVVVDDMALPLGQLRIRPDGSAGGHNGLKDIIARLGGNDFARLRVGIGGPDRGDAVDHVLGRFADDEMKVIDDALGQAAKAVACWCDRGIDEAMTRFNRRPKPPKKETPDEATGDENEA